MNSINKNPDYICMASELIDLAYTLMEMAKEEVIDIFKTEVGLYEKSGDELHFGLRVIE